MDNLERFIRENREKIDRLEPSPGVWEKINGKGIFLSRKLLVKLTAAAVLILVVVSAMILYSVENRREKISYYSEEVKEMELFYNSMASNLYTQARPMLIGQPDIEKELEIDLARIDNICKEIKRDLKDNVDNQDVIEALIRNYTIKIHILEDMLRILKENENNTENRKSNEL